MEKTLSLSNVYNLIAVFYKSKDFFAKRQFWCVSERKEEKGKGREEMYRGRAKLQSESWRAIVLSPGRRIALPIPFGSRDTSNLRVEIPRDDI